MSINIGDRFVLINELQKVAFKITGAASRNELSGMMGYPAEVIAQQGHYAHFGRLNLGHLKQMQKLKPGEKLPF